MSEFVLKPWELPPDRTEINPPISVGPVYWQGEKTNLLLCRVERTQNRGFVFFRPQNEGDINFVACDSQNRAPIRPAFTKTPKWSWAFPKEVANTAAAYWGRLFYVGDACCFINRNECGWLTEDEGFAAFALPFAHLTAPSQCIFEWLTTELERPESEAKFALTWLDWDEKERSSYAESAFPSWQNLRVFLRAIAFNEEELHENLVWYLGDQINPSSVGYSPNAAKWSPPPQPLVTRLQTWSELIKPHYLPLPPIPEEISPLLRDYLIEEISTLRVSGEDANAHQKLEARLFLCDWLQENAPDRMNLLESS
ncbi:hypothetical protein EON83_01250 [bacterium]|nr:MAG: hypothetical protein EON83_01250 [bacterium]